MSFKRLGETIRIAIALPILQVMNLMAYANTKKGWPAKIATFVVFLPIIAFTTTCWLAAWVFLFRIAYRLAGGGKGA